MRNALAAAVVAAMWATGCDGIGSSGPAGPLVHEHHDVERGAASSARIEIDMSAGDLDMQPGATTLLGGDFEFNVPSLKPTLEYSVNGGTGTLKVSQGSANGTHENRWRLTLDEKTPVDLTVTLSAGDAKLVLGRLNLRSLAVRLGAGDLDIDLSGTPARSYSVKVQSGAGDTSIHLPASVGISAGTSGLVGDVNVSGLEKREGRWINPRAAASAVTVDVDVQHAVGDLKISAE